MKTAALILMPILLMGAAFYFYGNHSTVIAIEPPQSGPLPESAAADPLGTSTIPAALPPVGFAPPPLGNPPTVVYGKYYSAWSAGLNSRMNAFMQGASSSGINAAVIDVKDYSGYVSYKMDEVSGVVQSGADKQLRVGNIDALIKSLHDKNIYVIARVTVFQDPILAKAHPEWALKDKTTGGLWRDRKGLAWMDPAGKPTWDYVISIANDAFAHGADEVNFDYIRFPSDGNLENAAYPFWNGATPKHEVLRGFYEYLRSALPDKKISADLFGLTTVAEDDMGIGQMLEDALPYFDYICPMVYPSHFATGFQGYKNPANAPYQVVNFSMARALIRREALQAKSSTTLAKFRPWLQVFNLGATYTPAMVEDQIKATEDVFASSTDAYAGWLLWDPANEYKSYSGRL